MTQPRQTAGFRALVARGIPAPRAEEKIQNTRRGVLFLLAGGLFIAMAFGFVIYTMAITKGAPSLASMVFALLPGLPGAYFLLAGGHLLSGDAMRAAEESGGIITRTAARALAAARVKEQP